MMPMMTAGVIRSNRKSSVVQQQHKLPSNHNRLHSLVQTKYLIVDGSSGRRLESEALKCEQPFGRRHILGKAIVWIRNDARIIERFHPR